MSHTTHGLPGATADTRSAVPGRQRWVLAAVAVGGALGASARYAVSQVAPVEAGQFPWSTLAINVSGSLALGVVMVRLIERIPATRNAGLFATTGLIGGYTTYSTFAVETILLVRGGHLAIGAFYVVVSVVASLAAVWVGMRLARTGRHGGGQR